MKNRPQSSWVTIPVDQRSWRLHECFGTATGGYGSAPFAGLYLPMKQHDNDHTVKVQHGWCRRHQENIFRMMSLRLDYE
jgi:hypothetical protein